MSKILISGDLSKKKFDVKGVATCENCGCTAIYETYEIKINLWGGPVNPHIDCPNCGGSTVAIW